MSSPIYLHLTNSGGAQLKSGVGDRRNAKLNDLIEILALDHTVEIPTNLQTGAITGKRIHRPLKITKRVDGSTAELYKALTTGETLQKAELRFHKQDATGQDEQYFTVTLKGVVVSQIRAWSPSILEEEHGQHEAMEDVSFSYKEITWSHGTKMAEDKW